MLICYNTSIEVFNNYRIYLLSTSQRMCSHCFPILSSGVAFCISSGDGGVHVFASFFSSFFLLPPLLAISLLKKPPDCPLGALARFSNNEVNTFTSACSALTATHTVKRKISAIFMFLCCVRFLFVYEIYERSIVYNLQFGLLYIGIYSIFLSLFCYNHYI